VQTKLIIDLLTPERVSVLTKQYLTQDGIEYEIGLPHRSSWQNTAQGRELIAAELAEPYLSAVMAVWGDAPTVTEEGEDMG